jgi:hypothetical protein
MKKYSRVATMIFIWLYVNSFIYGMVTREGVAWRPAL